LGAIEEYKLKIKVFETNWMQKTAPFCPLCWDEIINGASS
jgi:hypothetical protein